MIIKIIPKINKIKAIILFFAVIFLFNFSSFYEAHADIMYNPNFDINAPGVKVIFVAPPGIFTLPGSETTNFIQVCSLGEAFNIVLDVAGKNMVRFEDPIVDMCDNETIENLDNYIQLEKAGEVSIDSESLPYLKDTSAVVTMRNLPFEEEPDIEVDGKPATDKDVENKNWDQSSKTLTFKAKHFTTYKAVSSVIEPPQKKEDFVTGLSDNNNTSKILIIIGVISMLILASYFILKKRGKES
jgi:hypothetical protein